MRKTLFTTTLLGLLAVVIPGAAADQHLVIVNIGDSLASGEGSPDAPISPTGSPAVWVNPSCHQSSLNGRQVAADRINSMSGVSTSFFDFSCSGAKIGGTASFLPGGGLLSPQPTSQPNTPHITMPAQIEAVRDFQLNTLNGREIDILMISVGVNDINFESIVEACLVPAQLGDCTSSDAVQTAHNILNGTTLQTEFAQLAGEIRHKLRVGRVYITEYPNEGAISPNNFCGSVGLLDHSMDLMTPAKNQTLFNSLLVPLNNKIQQAVDAANAAFVQKSNLSNPTWTFVHGPKDTFATHGYCTSTAPFFQRRYVNTVQDSLLAQGDINGSMHPNKFGHEAYADALVAQATRDFDLPLETPRELRRVEVDANLVGSPISVAGPLNVTVEIAQHPGALSVVLQHRIVEPTIPFLPPPPVHAFTATAMPEVGTGELNLFTTTIPGFNAFIGQSMQYRFVITATINGETVTRTTSTRTVSAGTVLLNQ